MRKRDRDRLARQIKALADELYQMPLQQLYGAEWYFANNAELKGCNNVHAALSWLVSETVRLKKLANRCK